MNPQRLILIAALAVFGAACTGDRETREAGPNDENSATPAPAASATKPPGEGGPAQNVTALHMHHHAEQLAHLDAALAAGDLEAAGTPAYWLSRHESVAGIDADLMQHLDDMRAAALETEQATDLAVARSAAGRIAEACESCHDAAGIDADIRANAAAP